MTEKLTDVFGGRVGGSYKLEVLNVFISIIYICMYMYILFEAQINLLLLMLDV